jgi:periplasmic divalent cation tolerance protein
MDTIYAIVTTTASSKEEADRIARALLERRLAACVQVSQVQSYYTWQENLNIDDEWLLVIKCKQADFADIQECIKINHSYEIPEIIQVPITAGLPDYLGWIDDVTR